MIAKPIIIPTIPNGPVIKSAAKSRGPIKISIKNRIIRSIDPDKQLTLPDLAQVAVAIVISPNFSRLKESNTAAARPKTPQIAAVSFANITFIDYKLTLVNFGTRIEIFRHLPILTANSLNAFVVNRYDG